MTDSDASSYHRRSRYDQWSWTALEHTLVSVQSLYLSDDQDLRSTIDGVRRRRTRTNVGPRTDNVLYNASHRTAWSRSKTLRRGAGTLRIFDQGLQPEAKLKRRLEARLPTGRHSHAAVPILNHQNLVGVLYISRDHQGRGWSTEDLVMLLEIDAISVVPEHSDAYAQQHERDRLVEIGEMATDGRDPKPTRL